MAQATNRFDSVFVSEVLVEGRGGKAGWVELYNGGFSAVNLSDWFLSDSASNLVKWRFPNVVMLPDSYLVVTASGVGSTNELVDLRANFLLRKEGGEVALSRGGTNLVSLLVYPKGVADVSFGSVRGEPGIRGNFSQVTPGKANQSKGNGFAPAVNFSRAGGTFTNLMSVSLSAGVGASSNVVIRYTLDGSLPRSDSLVYREALQITNSMAVRARAFAEGMLPGPPGSEMYVSLGASAGRFKSTLPVLVMSTVGYDRVTRTASSFLSFYEPVGGRTSLEGEPKLVTRGSFHVRGSSTQGMPQPSLAMEFLDEFGGDENHPALGLPSHSDWVLYAPNMFDPVLIHNPFIHQLSRDMGMYSPRTRFLEVFILQHPGPLTANHYAGVYVLEEKIKIGKNRVAIDKLGADDLREPEVTGGYLMKFDRLGPGEQGFWAGGAEMVWVDPKEEVIELPQRAPQRRYFAKFLNDFERALQSEDWRDAKNGYPAFIDVNAWVDYHVLETLSGNVDVFRYSSFFHKPRGGKLTFGPHWDFDRALGSIDRRDNYPRRWNTGRFFDGPWWRQVFRDPDFWQLWVDRWQGLRRTHFSETNLFGLIDRLANEVREAQPRQEARWGLHPRGGSYQGEVDWMKDWLGERMDFIDKQLVQPPTISRAGGRVATGFQLTVTGSGGATIYYTLDGSDPRESQGGVSETAMVYSEPITIDRPGRVTIRARNTEVRQVGGPPVSTPWSSAVTADFTIVRR